MKNTFILLILLLASCTSSNKISSIKPEIIPIKQINEFIKTELQKNGDFKWSSASNQMLYSALMQADSLLTVCYKLTPDGESRPSKDSKVNGKLPAEWVAKRNEITQYILQEERAYRKQPFLTLYDLFRYNNQYSADRIPCFTIQVTSFDLILQLRNDKTIRAVEPRYHHIEDIYLQK